LEQSKRSATRTKGRTELLRRIENPTTDKVENFSSALRSVPHEACSYPLETPRQGPKEANAHFGIRAAKHLLTIDHCLVWYPVNTIGLQHPMRKLLKQLWVEERGLETAEFAFLAVFVALAAILFLPNSEETIDHALRQYARVLFPNW
jgi:Flp pilus assembly pilin Flp